jgi:hypothetical protein
LLLEWCENMWKISSKDWFAINLLTNDFKLQLISLRELENSVYLVIKINGFNNRKNNINIFIL